MTDKAILHEKDLVSCLVKILDPDTNGIIGTGFFCHPEGYILTCYHVITSYIKKRHNEVLLSYEETRLNAQICEEYCSKEADIAILKTTMSCALPFYALLDVHDRWTIDDHIWSYGYPKGNFMEPGIGVTGSISGTTRIDGVEVIQINDLSIQIVGHGYSGAPVFHLRTKKIIGLIHAKIDYHDHKTNSIHIKGVDETQAFFIPLKKLFQKWPELKDFHDVFKKIRLKIAQEAEEKLNEKIRGCPYIPLRLEGGIILEKESSEIEEQSREWSHGRKWENFKVNKLLPFLGTYILSSSVGTGKTTFILWLAKELIEKTDYVPLFIPCEYFEDISPNNWNELRNQLVSHYTRFFLEEDINQFFNIYFKQQKTIFLFDGLDQIKSSDYVYIKEKIKKITFPCPVLISSRPSAVLFMEDNPDIPFLRLQPFSVKEKKLYFGDDYEKAKKLSIILPNSIQSIHNFFTNRSTIMYEDQFIGRSLEIANILSRLHNHDSVSVVGERRIGKSSLLYHLYLTGNRQLNDPMKIRFKFIYLDLHDPQLKTINGLCKLIIEKIGIQNKLNTINNLDSLSILSKSLDIISSKKVLPVLLMDEFEALLEKPESFNNDCFEAFRSFANNHKLAIITSSYHTLLELTEKKGLTSPLWNIFTIQYLGEFVVNEKYDEVTEFLITFWNYKLKPTPKEKAFLISYCSYHPLVLQVVSYWVLENRRLRLNEIALKQQINNELSSFFRNKKQLITKWLKRKMPAGLEKLDWTSGEIRKIMKKISLISFNIDK